MVVAGRYPTLSITNSKKTGVQEARASTTKPMTDGPLFVTTQDFTATHSLAKRVETALESLPNNVIEEIQVRTALSRHGRHAFPVVPTCPRSTSPFAAPSLVSPHCGKGPSQHHPPPMTDLSRG